jgi:hypothetical protein
MSGFGQDREERRQRRSSKVALVLLGTAGVVAVAAGVDAWQKSRDAEAPVPAPQPSGPQLSTAQTYSNNDYIPGVGYYHAPFFGWYPFPYNHYDPTRGYYAGGLWQAAPFVLAMMSSRPSHDAVTAALAAQRARQLAEQQQQQQWRSNSGFWNSFRSGGGSSGARSFSPRTNPAPSSTPSSGSHSIQRGGFGSSGHSSGGSS